MHTDRATTAAAIEDVLRRRRARRPRPDWPVLCVIAAGGVAGSLARHAVSVAVVPPPRGFAWATFLVNVSGCLLIGVLMVLILEVWSPHRLLRPFLGVGVLGGFTTFSTYTVDAQRLLVAGAPGVAVVYVAGTLVTALAATTLGVTLARVFTRSRRKGAPG